MADLQRLLRRMRRPLPPRLIRRRDRRPRRGPLLRARGGPGRRRGCGRCQRLRAWALPCAGPRRYKRSSSACWRRWLRRRMLLRPDRALHVRLWLRLRHGRSCWPSAWLSLLLRLLTPYVARLLRGQMPANLLSRKRLARCQAGPMRRSLSCDPPGRTARLPLLRR